jgi:hypothetical protein
MAADDFLAWPEDLQQLIDDIGSVEGLDVMCLVARGPSAAWRIDQLSDELAVDRFLVDDAIRRLVGKGLLEQLDNGTVRPADEAAARRASLDALSNLCQQDRANVLGAIAHCSIGRIRTSAVRAVVRRPPGDRNES